MPNSPDSAAFSESPPLAQHPVAVVPRTPLTIDRVIALLDRARWAPSGDNCQPWRVRIAPESNWLDVVRDRRQPYAFLDIRGESTLIAVGAFACSLQLAASSLGMSSKLELRGELDDVLARIHFVEQRTAVPDSLSRYLVDRKSNRHPFEPEPIDGAILESLSKCGEGSDLAKITFLRERNQIRTVARAIGLAEQVRMIQPACHREFHSKICWSISEAETRREGFLVDTFEISKIEQWMLRTTRDYNVLKLVDSVTGLSFLAGRVARKLAEASGAIGVLQVARWETLSLLAAGIALQRALLRATELGLEFQVMAVAPILVRRATLRLPGYDDAMAMKIRRCGALLEAALGTSTLAQTCLLVRVGYGQPPSARTFRLRPEDLILRQA